jgi:lipid II:glycine glycyltransferase (peptidoglycan interpeptide bridge formation enzyme)
VFMVKIEPEIVKTDETLVELMKLGLLKVRNVQPNASTILLDISGELDGILASLNQKGRHAIRRAERDGAVIKQVPATEEHCREMYRLYKLTAEGQFSARPYQYYKHFWQTFERSGMGQLFFAYANDQLVAGAYAIVLGEKSVYKDGASLRERPVYGISHLLQWHVIQWSQSKGAKVHDFLGSPPSDQINNPKHPYYGFGRFKVSFSKNVVDFVGAYDCIVRPYRYTLWTKLGERIVLRWHFWRHHESFY